MKRFENKVVLVTGGASGIGRACAERLAQEGAAIAIGDIDIDAAQGVAASVAYLASDEPLSVTGIALSIDGGQSAG